MKELLYTVKTNLTQTQAEKKITKIMQEKINEASKVKYDDLVELLKSDLNNFLAILNKLYANVPLEEVEEMYYRMDTSARDDFIIFCKIESENHKPFFSGCTSIDDLKMKLIKDKNFRFIEEFDGLNFTLTLKQGRDFAKTLQLPWSCYKFNEVKQFCYTVLNESKNY